MRTEVWKGNVVTRHSILIGGAIVIEDGVIVDVKSKAPESVTRDFGDAYLAPGFIDIHCHGINGADAMEATEDAILRMAQNLAKHGVTGFLPTTVTQDINLTIRTVTAIRQFMDAQADKSGAQALGIHLEGPWISIHAKGAQNGDYVIKPELDTVRRVLDAAGGTVRKVSIAPEVEGAKEVIRWLADHGVYASVAHTTATYEQTVEAFDAGALHVTHCFNAMTGLHHRNPGVVGASLLTDHVYAELIADGVHVHPAAMRILIKNKGVDKVMLISDSIAATDKPDGDYSLGGLQVFVREGQARLADGTLAGSTLTLDRAVRNLVNLCNVAICDAIAMASTVPAEAIGLGLRKGQIRPGYDADIVILDRALMPIETITAKSLLHPAE